MTDKVVRIVQEQERLSIRVVSTNFMAGIQDFLTVWVMLSVVLVMAQAVSPDLRRYTTCK